MEPGAHDVHHTVILGARFIVAHDVLYIYEHEIPCTIINNLWRLAFFLACQLATCLLSQTLLYWFKKSVSKQLLTINVGITGIFTLPFTYGPYL